MVHEFWMRISTNNITVEDILNEVKEEEKKEEAHKSLIAKRNEDVSKLDFEFSSR